MLISSVDEVFDKLFKMQTSGDFYFRGISNEKQKYPSLMRIDDEYGIGLSDYEIELLDEFCIKTSSLLNGSLTDMDVVGYAQHFGLPTRLVDWTKNPFVALFFAINRKSAGTYKILSFRKRDGIELRKIHFSNTLGDMEQNTDSKIENYKKFITKLTTKDGKIDVLKSAYDSLGMKYYEQGDFYQEIINKIDKMPFFFNSSLSNQRLINQQGLYMIPDKLSKKEIDEFYQDYCEEIEISGDIRESILLNSYSAECISEIR